MYWWNEGITSELPALPVGRSRSPAAAPTPAGRHRLPDRTAMTLLPRQRRSTGRRPQPRLRRPSRRSRRAGSSSASRASLANDHVDFELRTGEIHALLGENGAGKSTLMNILAGLYRPDEGEIRLDGAPVSFGSPRDAIAAGLGMVHQHFTLVPSQSVTENVLLGLERAAIPPRRAPLRGRGRRASPRSSASACDPRAQDLAALASASSSGSRS